MAGYTAEYDMKSQKKVLQKQAHCGYPKIERQATKMLEEIKHREREAAEFNKKVRIKTITLQSQSIKNDFKKCKRKGK